MVGITDFLILLATWVSCPAPPANCVADFDESGDVGVTDFLLLLGKLGVEPPGCVSGLGVEDPKLTPALEPTCSLMSPGMA